MLCDKNSNIRTCDDYFYITRERPAMRRGPAGLHHMSTVPRRAAALTCGCEFVRTLLGR